MISFKTSQLDIDGVFGPNGLLSKTHSNFEVRSEQVEMAKGIQDAFENQKHLVVEAGTGTGKSFAYLVSAIDSAVSTGRKTLISTYTINLQEQLINKDIPFLAQALDYDFTACLAKGRSNYLCLRRLKYALKMQQSLFDDFGAEVVDIDHWSKSTEDGSLSDLPFSPSMTAWDAVKSEHGNCKGRKCPYFKDCYYWKARRRLETADIIVANHALLFSDLALKESNVGVLPEYQYIIIDEAHNIEQVAEEHFGINLSNFAISYLLNGLYKTKGNKGLLAHAENQEAIDLVKKCKESSKILFAQIQSWYDNSYHETNGRCQPNFIDDNLTEYLRSLRLCLNRHVNSMDEDDDDKLEFERSIDRLKTIEEDIKVVVNQPQRENEHIYWIESSGARLRRITLRSAPTNVAPDIKRCLFDVYQSVITTSATLSCGHEGKKGFAFFTDRVGLELYEAIQLGSPFDYENQVTIHIEAGLPEPTHPAFIEEATEAVKRYILQSHGKAFLLFTSYGMLNKFADNLSDWLHSHDIRLLKQGGGIDRSTLLTEFKEDTNSVLFGTDSFWQGVDVPGESLSNVIIVRLPFAVPNHPLIQGKIERLRQEGKQPFFQFQLPSAIIKFKQGFGRLIRNKNDKGIIVILDSRIVNKPYGRQFLEAIPKCKIEISR